jgi:CheY-like chemotaxis protein
MPTSAMKIMYVEDNPANISLVQRIARMGGHQVVSFSNGEQCLMNFEKENPDLVFMDVQLEGRLNGLDVVRALRGRGMKQPIIAVTAYAMLGDKERCIEAGCDNYISKPLPITELVELVQRYEIEVSGASAAVAARATAEVPNANARKDEPSTPAAAPTTTTTPTT